MSRPRQAATPANSVVPKVVWRFADLRASGVVKNHDMLRQLIAEEGFPPGIWLSANVHAWLASEVMAWVSKRPAKRPPPKQDLDAAGPEASTSAQPRRGRRRGRPELRHAPSPASDAAAPTPAPQTADAG